MGPGPRKVDLGPGPEGPVWVQTRVHEVLALTLDSVVSMHKRPRVNKQILEASECRHLLHQSRYTSPNGHASHRKTGLQRVIFIVAPMLHIRSSAIVVSGLIHTGNFVVRYSVDAIDYES